MKKQKVALPLLALLLMSTAINAQQLTGTNNHLFTGQASSVGQPALLFDSIDENFNPVSMADLTAKMPLVLLFGSCS